MFNPSTMTLGELSAALRDIAIFSGIAISGYKARALVQPLIDLYKRVVSHLDKAESHLEKAEKHMQVMETSMTVLLTNHLTHIEEYAKNLSENAQKGS